ncbi:MAG: serine/threonine-protein kinase [Planctomycetota bacterium]
MAEAERIDRFELERVLARGPKATVWRAWDPVAGRRVALKLLAAQVTGQAAARFDREIAAAATLRHPHLVCVFDAGRAHGRPYYAMEWVSGGTLQGEIDQRGARLETEQVLAWGTQLASALAALHDAGLIHRDVKPDNVLIDAHRTARLADLGLVKDLRSDAERLTLSHAPHGSPGYWSPEQAGSELDALSPATDVYGLGATLFAALAGRPPIVDETLAGHVARAMAGNTDSLAELRPDLNPRLIAVIERCLHPTPERRYPDGAALEAALRALDAPPPVARRVPQLVLAALVPLAVVACGLAVLWTGPTPAPAERSGAAPAPAPPPEPAAPEAPPGGSWPAPGAPWRWVLTSRARTPAGGDFRWSWTLECEVRERSAAEVVVTAEIARLVLHASDGAGTVLDAFDTQSGEAVTGATGSHLQQALGQRATLRFDRDGACRVEGFSVPRLPRVQGAPMQGYAMVYRTFSADGLGAALTQLLRLPDPGGARQASRTLWILGHRLTCVTRGDRTADGATWSGRVEGFEGRASPGLRRSLGSLVGGTFRLQARSDDGPPQARLTVAAGESSFESTLER